MISIEPIARYFFNAPNEDLSSKTELRFGKHGSVSVDLNWSRLSVQKFRVDKWGLCRG
jgi:hypothetical protein